MKVILAYSGGPDSVYLLHDLIQKNISVLPIYFDHGLRKHNDTQYLTIPHINRKIPVRKYAEKHGISLEASGRYWRYRMLKHFQKLKNIPTVMTAHHLDDHCETFYLNFHRGSRTLGGILKKQPFGIGELHRPLLHLSKSQILSHLHNKNIPYAVDESNSDTIFKRNQWRNIIIPEIEKAHPDYKKILQKQLRAFQEETSFWETQIQPHLQCTHTPWDITWHIPAEFAGFHPALQKRLIAALLKKCNPDTEFSSEHVDILLNAITQGKAPVLYDFPNGMRCDRLKTTLRFSWGHQKKIVFQHIH